MDKPRDMGESCTVMTTTGFIGLGNMGRPMAENLAAAGHRLCVHDAAGSAERAPEGAAAVGSAAHVAAVADPILLSLPDGAAVRSVVDEIRESPNAVTHTIVDTSTIGIAAARSIGRALADDGFEYVDAPVSGGVAGARAATLAIMFAGSSAAWNRLSSLLDPLCRHLVYVGRRPGQGQAMKVLNNYLSATAMAATSEAVSFGVRQGLEMSTMLDVLNASSGMNTATADKFPNRVLTGTFDAGFAARLLRKDVSLYVEAAAGAGVRRGVAESVFALWDEYAADHGDEDFTRVFPFVQESGDK